MLAKACVYQRVVNFATLSFVCMLTLFIHEDRVNWYFGLETEEMIREVLTKRLLKSVSTGSLVA